MADNVLIPGVLIHPRGEPKGVLIGVADGGKETLLDHPSVRAAHDSGWAVVLTDLRGMGELTITKPGWVYAVSLLLGENLVARQALDLISGARALRAEPWMKGKRTGVLACGLFASLAGLYAGVMEPEIDWVAGERGIDQFRHVFDRSKSSKQSFALAEAGKEREVKIDREIPHALIPWKVHFGPDIPDYLKHLGKDRAVWAAAIDGDFDPVPSPPSSVEFIRARMEESR